MRILVADDDLVLTRLLEQRLHEQGYEVMVARDAMQTWRFIQREKPDLVVLDIKMPGGSGLAVLRRLRNNLIARHAAVVVITAVEDESTVHLIRALRPDALLRKPFKWADFDLEITRLLAAREFAHSPAPRPPKGAM